MCYFIEFISSLVGICIFMAINFIVGVKKSGMMECWSSLERQDQYELNSQIKNFYRLEMDVFKKVEDKKGEKDIRTQSHFIKRNCISKDE